MACSGFMNLGVGCSALGLKGEAQKFFCFRGYAGMIGVGIFLEIKKNASFGVLTASRL